MKKLVLIGIVLAAAYFGGVESGLIPGRQQDAAVGTNRGDEVLAAAFEDRRRGVQVEGSGHVTRTLPDDNSGSRHQRFIVRLASGQTVLVAHNIDLANRVASVKAGDPIEFYGEYEWNAQGGVIHWTHRDPQRRHVDGWIKHDGRTYQ
jgi:Protein of unknown function (DUF3465)